MCTTKKEINYLSTEQSNGYGIILEHVYECGCVQGTGVHRDYAAFFFA